MTFLSALWHKASSTHLLCAAICSSQLEDLMTDPLRDGVQISRKRTSPAFKISSFDLRDNCYELASLGVAIHIIEKLLNHTGGTISNGKNI